MDQLLGGVHPAHLCDRERRCADVLGEEPPQVAASDAHAARERLHVGFLERARVDQCERASDRVRRPAQRGETRGELGRQRRQGLNPASTAAAAEGMKTQFSGFGGLAGQIGRQ